MWTGLFLDEHTEQYCSELKGIAIKRTTFFIADLYWNTFENK